MFLGHYAMAFAAKKAAPHTSLGTLFIAAQFVDLLWPVLVLAGVEHVRINPGDTVMTPLDFYDYPYSHSMLTGILFAVLSGLVYWMARRRKDGAIAVGACVFSHWILDLIAHRPDLPLFPGSGTRLGLGLWNSAIGTIVVELGLFAAGVAVYTYATGTRNRTGIYRIWALVIFLLVVYIANTVGPPPPDTGMIAYAGLSMWLLVLWAYWADKQRNTAGGG